MHVALKRYCRTKWPGGFILVIAALMGVLGGALGQKLLSPERALAYDNFDQECHQPYSGGWDLFYPYYTNDPLNPPGTLYQSAFDAARVDWNNSATPVSFVGSVQPNWTFGAKNFGANGASGVTYYGCGGSGGKMNYAHVWENRAYMDSDTVFRRQAVASHEIGHLLGLGHSSYTAIMGINDGSFNGTLSDDWCGINHIYANNWFAPQCGY